MNTILVPIDFSAGTKILMAEASDLAAALTARLVLLHVVEPLPAVASEFQFVEAAARIATHVEREIEHKLLRLQRELQARGVNATTFHVVGVPGPSIVAQARDFDATYIVMGSHGDGAFYELSVGSTANRVLKEAHCPVIIVPTRAARTRTYILSSEALHV
jgi:nucleotide-binding universal stress UspA family protein